MKQGKRFYMYVIVGYFILNLNNCVKGVLGKESIFFILSSSDDIQPSIVLSNQSPSG